MKLLFDLFPIILFFIAYKVFGIYVATTVAIAATVVQIAWTKYRHPNIHIILFVCFLQTRGEAPALVILPARASARALGQAAERGSPRQRTIVPHRRRRRTSPH